MGRRIAGIVAGYLVMFVFVFAFLAVAYFVMGADRAFKPGTYQVTTLWLAVSTVLSLAAAVLGGLAATALAREARVAKWLAIVVVVLGVILAIPMLNAPRTEEVRTSQVGNTEAMMKAQQPPAISILNPVIGAVGVLLGGRLRRPAE